MSHARLVAVDMGRPRLTAASIPTLLEGNTAEGHVVKQQLHVGDDVLEVTCVSMGNPHAVVFVDDLCAVDL